MGCPKGLIHATAAFPEVMTLGLGTTDQWNEDCFATLREHLHRFSAVVFGPGLGRATGAMEFLRAYLRAPHHNTLYDADALFLLAQDQDLLAHLNGNGPDPASGRNGPSSGSRPPSIWRGPSTRGNSPSVTKSILCSRARRPSSPARPTPSPFPRSAPPTWPSPVPATCFRESSAASWHATSRH